MPDMMDELEGELRKGIQDGRQLYAIFEKLLQSGGTAQAASKAASDFVFTGQVTDLRYFQNANTMPVNLIQKIPDVQLKQAVMDEFNKAIADGKLSIDLDKNMISVTDKGREFIAKPEFQTAASRDLQAFAENRMQSVGVELNGTMQDIGYFQYADQLELSKLMQGDDSGTFLKITQNFQNLANEGIVSIDKTAITLTEKGKALLGSDMMKSALSGMTEKAMPIIAGSTPAGAVFVVTKQLLTSGINAISKGSMLK